MKTLPVISKAKLAKYLHEHYIINTRFDMNVYLYQGQLCHTIGSMEYRDNDHTLIGRFSFYNEHAPYSLADCKRMVNAIEIPTFPVIKDGFDSLVYEYDQKIKNKSTKTNKGNKSL
jgi:hypothetical protein